MPQPRLIDRSNINITLDDASIASPFVLLRMPVKIGLLWKFLILVCTLIILSQLIFIIAFGLFMNGLIEGPGNPVFFVWMNGFNLMMGMLFIMILSETPIALEVTETGVILHRRFSSHALPFSRMISIEIVRSAWVYSGQTLTRILLCTRSSASPQGAFTATSDCIFLRANVNERSTSIAFSPEDLKQLLETIQQTQQGCGLIDVASGDDYSLALLH